MAESGEVMSLFVYRVGNWLSVRRVPVLPRFATLLNRIVLGAYIPSECTIGAGTKLAYGGSGLVLHPRVVIGPRCLLSPGVVVGGRGGHAVVPVVGSDVKLFPGAKVLGPIVVGDGAVIGANAVVVDNVPPGAVIVAPKGHQVTT
jgi:serine O-acetyltransferase